MSSIRLTTLEDLYPDALLKIVEYLSPTWIVKLWLTGSVQLRTSIAKRGVLKSLTLRHPGGYFSTSRLPGMIASLEALTRLTIHAPENRIARPHRMWECLSKLSQLKELELDFLDVDEWLFCSGPSADELLPRPPGEIAFASLGEPTHRTLRPIATSFPNLETLDLTSTRPGLFQNEHVAQLPPSLTSLVLLNGGSINEGCLDYIGSLPKLAQLRFRAPDCVVLSKPLPSSSLTSLSIMKDEKPITIEPSFWSTSLSSAPSKMVELKLPLAESSVAHLPPTITKLELPKVPDFSTLSLAHLPLTSIKVRGCLGKFTIPRFNSPLETLDLDGVWTADNVGFDSPIPTVKYLNLDWDHGADASIIMQYIGHFTQLLELKMTTWSIIDPLCFQDLPLTLTSLHWNNRKPWHSFALDSILEKLPGGLRELNLFRRCFTISTAFFRHLPRSLLKMNIFVVISQDTTDQDAANHFLDLPRSLQSLIMLPYVIPPSLPSHGLVAIELLTSMPLAASWDPNLTPMGQALTQNHFAWCSHREDGDFIWTAEMARNLPDLECLEVGNLEDTVWTEEMALSLPRSLREFCLESTAFSSSLFKSLPPNLHTLTYETFVPYDTSDTQFDWLGEDFSMLPRSLTKLVVSYLGSIEDEHLALLPDLLLAFQSALATKLTKTGALAHLPIHCLLSGSNSACYAQNALNERLRTMPLLDPDPRVLGHPFNWN